MGNSLQAVAAFWQLLQNMLRIASGKSNFLYEDDFDVIMAVIATDMLQNWI